jgi:pimeloyl-ACP methyl ester carboxylesterase
MARIYRPDPNARFVEANGCRFGYLEWGAGAPVLLLHGFPDSAHGWSVIGPAIAAAGFRVVAPFLRGYAPSAVPARDTDSRTLGEDVLALIDAFGGTARVVGHDWGAEAAYAAVGLGPERFARLVTVAIPHRAALTPTPALVWALRHFFALKLPGAARRFARDDFARVELLCRRWSPTWTPTPEELEPVKNAFAAPGSLDAAIGYYRAASFGTPAFLRGTIAVPSLAVAGADDPGIAPAAFEQARRQYSGAYSVAVIPGGHFCHRESPQPFLDAVLPFLRG